GIDYTSYRIFSRSDAFAFGVLTGDTEAFARSTDGTKTNVKGPSVGIYGVYVHGGFSVDFNSKVDFLSIDQSTGFTGDLKNYVTSGNVNYKFYAPRSIGGWVEPTA